MDEDEIQTANAEPDWSPDEYPDDDGADAPDMDAEFLRRSAERAETPAELDEDDEPEPVEPDHDGEDPDDEAEAEEQPPAEEPDPDFDPMAALDAIEQGEQPPEQPRADARIQQLIEQNNHLRSLLEQTQATTPRQHQPPQDDFPSIEQIEQRFSNFDRTDPSHMMMYETYRRQHESEKMVQQVVQRHQMAEAHAYQMAWAQDVAREVDAAIAAAKLSPELRDDMISQADAYARAHGVDSRKAAVATARLFHKISGGKPKASSPKPPKPDKRVRQAIGMRGSTGGQQLTPKQKQQRRLAEEANPEKKLLRKMGLQDDSGGW